MFITRQMKHLIFIILLLPVFSFTIHKPDFLQPDLELASPLSDYNAKGTSLNVKTANSEASSLTKRRRGSRRSSYSRRRSSRSSFSSYKSSSRSSGIRRSSSRSSYSRTRGGCSSSQCTSTTQKGLRCKNRTTSCSGVCYLHQ